MQVYKFILESHDGHTGRIVLNRPDVHNAMHIEMIREISRSFQYLNDLDNIRFIVIEAIGPNFSSGADLNWMRKGLSQSGDELMSESLELAHLFNMIYHSKKVSLVLAKGKVMGGANGIIAAADISIASAETSFAFTEVRLGLVPATIAPYIVSKTGTNVAREWMLTGRNIDAREACERGLINRVFPEENFQAEFQKLSDLLLKNGPKAMAGIKKMFRDHSFSNPDELIEESAELLAQFRISDEGQEGIKAFLIKENPIGAMSNPNSYKILVANRGEIALRIIKTIQKVGLKSVAIYADNDFDLPFVSAADESWPLGEGALHDTYLNIDKILDIAKQSGATAIHPGYGFLSENANFAKACETKNIVFIGPGPEVIDLMGNKSNARQTAKKMGIPVIDGITGNADEILRQKSLLQYPLLIKPAAGGGGKGMKIVHSIESLHESINDAAREAMNYFGSAELYLERYIEEARHIEVQLLADHHGNIIHLFERECSLQRRYQKIIEEAPAVSISAQTRKAILETAIKLAERISYTNAGTIEFLVDKEERFFFIEMNTRIQVEHPVTEMITGIDIVREQINVSEGKVLSFNQKDIKMKGHAIEARIYAENPSSQFMPSTGLIKALDYASVSARIDSGYRSHNILSTSYDPMIAKITAHGDNRQEAIEKLSEAIIDFHISGIETNREFLYTLLQSKEFHKNAIHTKYIDKNLDQISQNLQEIRSEIDPDIVLIAASLIALSQKNDSPTNNTIWNEIGHWRLIPQIKIKWENASYVLNYTRYQDDTSFLFEHNQKSIEAQIISQVNSTYFLDIHGEKITCWGSTDQSEINIDLYQHHFKLRRTDVPDSRYIEKSNFSEKTEEKKEITAPLNGKIVKVHVAKNDFVQSGDTLLVIESMKMENKIICPRDAEVLAINVEVGDAVELNKILIKLK